MWFADWQFKHLNARLIAIETLLVTLVKKEKHMSQIVSDLIAAVTAQTTVVESTKTLLVSLHAEYAAALAAAKANGDFTGLDAVLTTLQGNTDTLAAAVAANTDAPPAAPVAPAPAAPVADATAAPAADAPAAPQV